MRLAIPAALMAALAALPVPALAEVQEQSASGFTVGGEVTLLHVTEQDVWATLIRPGAWWSSDHTFSGDATNMTLDPVAGGCFCEQLPGATQGSVEHMRIIYAEPGKLLRMRGSLGPLQDEALAGVLTIGIDFTIVSLEEPRDADIVSAASITWTYVVGGHARFGLEEIAPAVDGVLAEQMQRLAQSITPGAAAVH